MEEKTNIKLNLKALGVQKTEDEEMTQSGVWNTPEVPVAEVNLKKQEENIQTPWDEVQVSKISQGESVENSSDVKTEAQEESSEELAEKKPRISLANIQNKNKASNKKLEMQKQKEAEALLKAQQEEVQKASQMQDAENSKEKVEFKNYESDFHKQKQHIYKKIRSFKYGPKTNTSFVISLIAITIFSIALLMVFFPEKHSISNYKASLIQLFNDDAQPRKMDDASSEVFVEETDGEGEGDPNPEEVLAWEWESEEIVIETVEESEEWVKVITYENADEKTRLRQKLLEIYK